MKQFYVCLECEVAMTDHDLVEGGFQHLYIDNGHNRLDRPLNEDGSVNCTGTFKPAFFADDLREFLEIEINSSMHGERNDYNEGYRAAKRNMLETLNDAIKGEK